MVDNAHLIATTPTFIGCSSYITDDVICFGVQNCAECAIILAFGAVCSSCLVQFGSRRDKCLVEVSIRQDGGQEPYNRECPDHIGAVGTYVCHMAA